jgi:hypothetical protein
LGRVVITINVNALYAMPVFQQSFQPDDALIAVVGDIR